MTNETIQNKTRPDRVLKALKFLGLNDQYIASLLESDKINQQ